jgi:high-affinity nickel-transport protein
MTQRFEWRHRAIYLLSGIVVINIVVWLLALAVFRDNTTLMGTALLAYSFGLRHAVDADHIAAIDNVTRKLMQQGKAPVAVGTFFSLGAFHYCGYGFCGYCRNRHDV